MNLLTYNNKKIVLTDIDNKQWVGMAYYCDADTNETAEDVLIVKTDKNYIEFLESEIKAVDII